MTLPDNIKPGWFQTGRIGAWPVCAPWCPSRGGGGEVRPFCLVTGHAEIQCRPMVGAMAKELGLPTAQPRGGGA